MPKLALRRHSLQTHFLLGMVVAAVAATVIIASGTLRTERQRLEADLATDSRAFASLMDDLVVRESRNLEMSLEMMLADPEIGRRMAAGDREWLSERLVPQFESRLKPEFGVSQLHFHEPNAHSFLRVHQPKKFGDDLSRFRATVVQANARRAVVRGLEVGRFGPGLRVVAPVTSEGRHVGTVDIGADMGQLLAALADRVGLEFAIGIRRDVFANAGREADSANEVVNGDLVFYEFHGELAAAAAAMPAPEPGEIAWRRLDGNRVVMSVIPLRDWSDQEIGSVLLVHGAEQQLAAANLNALRNAGMIVFMLLVLMGAFAVLVRTRILNPLRVMTEVTGNIAAGDLKQRVQVRGRDEMASLGESLNGMVACLHEIILSVNKGSEQIAGAAMELDGRSEQTVEDTRQALHLAADVEASGENLRTGSQSIALSTQAITERLQQMSDGISQMDDTIRDIARSSSNAGQLSRDANDQVQKAASVARDLAVSSSRINQVVDVISQIASRTNLLALNATIEAAGAGEAGRSFSVVANEVKELARQTSQATGEVRQLIQTVQGQIEEVVARIGGIETAVADVQGASLSIASAVEEQSATSSGISRASTALRDDALSIAARAESGAAEADAIARSIAGVRDSLDQAVAQVTATRENSIELTSLSETLQESVVVFHV